jgi:hypothetical protein
VLYVPNQSHNIRDMQRVVAALSALHRYSVRDEPLPALSWRFASSARALQVSVQPGRKPSQVVAWNASSATRDFRDAHWSSQRCRESKGEFRCTRAASASAYTALFSEVTFKDRGEQDFALSTAVCIVDAAGTMVRPCLDNAPAAH